MILPLYWYWWGYLCILLNWHLEYFIIALEIRSWLQEGKIARWPQTKTKSNWHGGRIMTYFLRKRHRAYCTTDWFWKEKYSMSGNGVHQRFQGFHSLALHSTWNTKFENHFWLLNWYQLFGINGTQHSSNHRRKHVPVQTKDCCNFRFNSCICLHLAVHSRYSSMSFWLTSFP